MVPAAFDGANCILSAPDGMTHEQCSPLNVMLAKTAAGFPAVISCWKLTQGELDIIAKTGRVWLMVMGETMPPVVLTGDVPFEVPT